MTLRDDLTTLTTTVGMVPMNRDVVSVTGPDAADFLQGQLSQDIAPVGVGGSTMSLLLQPQGKVDAWLRVSRVAEEQWVLDVDGGWGAHVAERLVRFRLRVAVEIEQVRWEALAVRGPLTDEVEAVATVIEAVRWPGVEGVDLLGETVQAPPAVPACDPVALEILRIEAGVPRMGAELDESTIPAAAGIVEGSVSFTKGCYVGQELVARIDSRGGNVPRRLHRVVVDGPAEAAQPVTRDGETVGSLTSAAWSPLREATVALGYLRRGTDIDLPLEVAGRPARVVPPT